MKTVAACFCLGLLFGIAFASGSEYIKRFRNERPEDFAKLRQIGTALWGRSRKSA
jgi:hypothetical protein